MSKTLLLHTVGNSDWQFDGSQIDTELASKYLDAAREGKRKMMTLKKAAFRKNCLDIWDEMKQQSPEGQSAERQQRFPLLEPICDYVIQDAGKIDLLVPFFTQQVHTFSTDTDGIFEPLAAYFRFVYTQHAQIASIFPLFKNFSNHDSDTAAILHYFDAFLKEKRAEGYTRIYICATGGLPIISQLLRYVGLFQAYTYLVVDAQKGVYPILSYPAIETFILKQIHEKTTN